MDTEPTTRQLPRRSDASVRKLIQAECNRYVAAFKNRDVEAIANLLTPDFTWKLIDGSSIDREETEAAIEDQMAATIRVYRMDARIERLIVHGDQATVYTRERLVAAMLGGDGSPERLATEETYRDTWVRTPRGWRFALAEALTSKTSTRPEKSGRWIESV